MFCSRCGHAAPDEAASCPSCGASMRPTTPAQALAAGSVREEDVVREALGDEYELLEELGRGGMAIVYRARERALDREVAIKLLPFQLAFDQDFVSRFEREARTAAALEHPNIIPIYRVGKAGQIPYFVMKLLRGGALSQRMGGGRRLASAEIRRLLAEAARALGHAAQRGVVHRDIKPDNIMFDEFGTTVLTDFGIAMAASGQRLTGTGMSIGTPHYMSPEQARAQQIDGRSDIYALGIVAYEALAGRVPFDGEDSFAIGYQHITEPLPEPVLADADERRLFDVIKRMTDKDPRRRHQDAEELIAALEGRPAVPRPAVAPPPGEPTAPLPASDLPGPRRPVARRPRHHARRSRTGLWASLALVAAAAGGAAGWYFLAGPGVGLRGNDVAPAGPAATEDSGAVPDSGRAGRFASVTGGAPGDSGRLADPIGTGSTPGAAAPAPEPVRDSGAVRVRGLPRGSTVLINETTATHAVTPLPVGRHAIAIVAQGYQFHVDTVSITLNDTLTYEPQLVRFTEAAGAGPSPAAPARPADPCLRPGPQYNRQGECYDERPRPLDATFVAVPEGVARAEIGSTVLWVQVAVDGRTVAVTPVRSSGSRPFDAAAQALARRTAWTPATRAGQAVAGWTQWEFRPMPE